jgi:hypothetical protein
LDLQKCNTIYPLEYTVKKIRQQKREDFRQKFIDDTRIAGSYDVRHSDISDKDLTDLKLKIKDDIKRDRKKSIVRAVIVTTVVISICLFILKYRI